MSKGFLHIETTATNELSKRENHKSSELWQKPFPVSVSLPWPFSGDILDIIVTERPLPYSTTMNHLELAANILVSFGNQEGQHPPSMNVGRVDTNWMEGQGRSADIANSTSQVSQLAVHHQSFTRDLPVP